MRPVLLRACTLSFCNRAASRLAPCLAAACERYLEWRRPQTFTCHQPARSTTSILIFFIAGLTHHPSLPYGATMPAVEPTKTREFTDILKQAEPSVVLVIAR